VFSLATGWNHKYKGLMQVAPCVKGTVQSNCADVPLRNCSLTHSPPGAGLKNSAAFH